MVLPKKFFCLLYQFDMAMDMYPPEKDFKYYLPNLGMSLFYQVLIWIHIGYFAVVVAGVLTVTSLELVP